MDDGRLAMGNGRLAMGVPTGQPMKKRLDKPHGM